MKNRQFMKHLSVGPGGIKCPCCFPSAGKRSKMFRKIRRKLNAETIKEIDNYQNE